MPPDSAAQSSDPNGAAPRDPAHGPSAGLGASLSGPSDAAAHPGPRSFSGFTDAEDTRSTRGTDTVERPSAPESTGSLVDSTSAVPSTASTAAPGAPASPARGRYPWFRAWLRATWLGWLLGIPCIALLALVGEALGVGGSQTLVGAGMGAGLGLTQGRLARELDVGRWRWLWCSMLGLGAPFLAWDVASRLNAPFTYSLLRLLLLGGLVLGLWQGWLVRHRVRGWLWWVAGSVVGWGLAGAGVHFGDLMIRTQTLRGIGGALLYLAVMGMGGAAPGTTLGLVLQMRATGSARPAAPHQ